MDFKGFRQADDGRVGRVRQAVREDAAAVRALLVETWHATYDGSLGAAKVTEITDAWHALEVLVRQIESPRQRFLVAERNSAIVGHAAASIREGCDLRLTRLYVLPSWQGNGVGSELLRAALADWPYAVSASLEVESQNHRAIQFYERAGFSICGETIEEGRTTLLMRRALY